MSTWHKYSDSSDYFHMEEFFTFNYVFPFFTLKVVFSFSYLKQLPINSQRKLHINIIRCQKELRMPVIILRSFTNNLGNMENFYSLQHLVRCDSHIIIFILHLKNQITKKQTYPLYKSCYCV